MVKLALVLLVAVCVLVHPDPSAFGRRHYEDGGLLSNVGQFITLTSLSAGSAQCLVMHVQVHAATASGCQPAM